MARAGSGLENIGREVDGDKNCSERRVREVSKLHVLAERMVCGKEVSTQCVLDKNKTEGALCGRLLH